jgi:uncharacterized protein (DUF58 family)
LDLKALAALEGLRFTTRHRIEGSYSGRHESRRHGGAGEFFDFREYSEGEDLRRLDWKVYGRTGKAFVRLFQDETNVLCTLAIDASGSMLFGDSDVRRGNPFSRRAGPTNKLEYAQFLAAALVHVVARGQDQVGLAVLSRGLESHLPPGGTPTHVATLQSAIENIAPEPATDLGKGLSDLFLRVTRRGVLLLMSDFLVEDLPRLFASVRLFRHRRWEVVLLHLIHPDEERLPEGAVVRFTGLEGEAHVDCSPAAVREAYQARFSAHAAAVRTQALACGCDYRRVSTSTPYLETLGDFLIERTG